MFIGAFRRLDVILFASALVTGLVAVVLLKAPLYRDPHALGGHVVALFVPYVLAVAFATTMVWLGRLDRRHAVASFVLFVLVMLPCGDLFFKPIVHFEGDDSYRYSLYAHNMLRKGTLWGSDGLIPDSRYTGRRYLIDQPGYRYYLALAIAVLGGEHRGMQIVNLGVSLTAVLTLLLSLQPSLDPWRLKLLALFLFGAAPYAAKNVMYGYSEWLAVALVMVWAALFARRRDFTALVVLAFVPFIRQNLLPASLLLAGVTVAFARRWWWLGPYAVVLAMPLLHNLYYAGEWRFLVANTGALFQPSGNAWTDVMTVLRTAASRLPHYAGYEPNQKRATLAIALFFAPLGTALVVAGLLTAAATKWSRALMVALVLLTVAPTLVLGGGSFPRFEFVNLSLILVAFAAVTGRAHESASGLTALPRFGRQPQEPEP